ncbi:hypothetical protein ACHAW6_003731 [Cyclotella cf. meneghiniana]
MARQAMEEAKSSILIISARNHLECVQKILKQVNEVSITPNGHHLNQKPKSECRRPAHTVPLTRAPESELGHGTLSAPPFNKSSRRSLDSKTEFESCDSRHRRQDSKATKRQTTAMLQPKGQRRSKNGNSSLDLTGIRSDKTEESSHLLNSRPKIKSTHILNACNGMRVSPLAPLNEGRSPRTQKQADRKRNNRKSNRGGSHGTCEFSQSDSNLTLGCMTYPCYRDRSDFVRSGMGRFSSRSEETSTAKCSNKVRHEDVLPPSILRRAKTESDIVRLEKRVSFIDDRSTSYHSYN